ncbi:MAG: NAD-dependent epimerase/dehydratase family protein, partial [Methanobacteriota archaeon]
MHRHEAMSPDQLPRQDVRLRDSRRGPPALQRPGDPVQLGRRDEVGRTMVVLVTGGTGYLGSQLIRDLPKMTAFKGETIRILDNQFRERYVSLWDLPKNVRYEFLEGDVRNGEAVAQALRDADVVFSLSDITNAPVSFERKELTWETNHKGV